jgi:Phosphodiester glycosidase
MRDIIRRVRWGCTLTALIIIMGFIGLLWTVEHSPRFAANSADVLRRAFGARFTARLEMTVFQIQDVIKNVKYDLGFAKPAAPWQVTLQTANPGNVKSTPFPTPVYQPTASVRVHAANLNTTNTPPAKTATPTLAGDHPAPATTGTPKITSTSIPSPVDALASTGWTLPNLAPLGKLQGEGIWQTYIQNTAGVNVSYRAFLQPDPSRPYAVAAVVAFDLTKTRLHYVLGSVEPAAPNSPKRSGAMPASDIAPGTLLAMFNGGFRANNGDYGAMADGVTALPPKDGLGVIAIYKDGSIRMGVWGTDILPTDNMEAWRQNGPLVVHQGAINPKIYDKQAEEWGYTVNNIAPTWRSGIGISADGNILYYFAGPSLTIEALAKSMVAAGVAEGLQLDINAYWVFFTAVHTDRITNTLDPLFPVMTNEKPDRYLSPSQRDFFYVTVKP